MPPLIRDLDGFIGSGHSLCFVALFLGVSDQLLKVLALKGIQNVEEVLSIRNSSLGQFVGEEHHELLISTHHRPQLDH